MSLLWECIKLTTKTPPVLLPIILIFIRFSSFCNIPLIGQSTKSRWDWKHLLLCLIPIKSAVIPWIASSFFHHWTSIVLCPSTIDESIFIVTLPHQYFMWLQLKGIVFIIMISSGFPFCFACLCFAQLMLCIWTILPLLAPILEA